ncbi:MAG: carboxypeptidase regulatory-like domain-containing protein [Candidatus Sumerlaeaceae bacterium]
MIKCLLSRKSLQIVIPLRRFRLRTVFSLFAFCSTLPLAAAPTTASLWGRVSYLGQRPQLELIEMRGDSYCSARQREARHSRQDLLVNEQGGVANALVYVKDGPIVRRADPQRKMVELAMRDCLFFPRVLGVQCGQKIALRNDDRTLHTVYARAKANPKFIHPLRGPDDPPFEFSFSAPELPVYLRCDVQPWMIAYVGVFDHPYFSVTAIDGTFELVNLPPGNYTIGVWHEKLGTLTEHIELKAGERRALELHFAGTR